MQCIHETASSSCSHVLNPARRVWYRKIMRLLWDSLLLQACWSASILFGAPILYGGSHNYDDSFPSPEKKRIKTRHQFLAPPLKETAAKDGSTSENSSSSWFRLFKLRKQLVSVSAIPDKQELPVTVQDTTDMVAANCPVFFFHHDERSSFNHSAIFFLCYLVSITDNPPCCVSRLLVLFWLLLL